MIGYDIDGVLDSGFEPTGDFVIISGRTFAEYDNLCRRLAQLAPLYIRGVGEFGDRQAAGEFKALMINHLGVTVFYEDDKIQADIICKLCPRTVVNIVSPPKPR